MKKRLCMPTALILSAALLLGLTACAPKQSESTPTPAATSSAAPEKTYTATAAGYGGDVTVTLALKDGKITSCKAEGPDETESIGGQALVPMADAIVKANGVAVDTVAGATFTCTAVIEAATAALVEAGVLEAPTASGMKAGEYTATSHGYTSDITIKTTVSDSAILSVDVVEQDDTVGIGSYAIERMPGAIVEQQTAMADTVSGATATSMAIRAAVTDCLKQAGADMAKFGKAPQAPTPTDETLDVDVVIIGAGAAGLTAGVEALDKGASVLVLEKMDIPGGNTVRSSGAFNVAGHPEQIAAGAKRSGVEEFITYTMTGGHDTNDPALVRYMVENSAAIVDWTRSIGFDTKFGETFGSCTVPGVARGLITGLWEKLEDRGGALRLSTKADELIMKDGKAAGVVATGPDGGTVTVNAKSVVVATGGFGYNLEMCYELKPEFDGFVTNNHVGATGDGIVMATDVGAATVDMEQIQAHPTVNQATATMLTEGCRTAGGLLINTSGERFIDECTYRDVVANAILAQDQKYAYLLMNQEIVDSNVNIAGYIKLGILTGYDTIAAAAEAMKVPADKLEKTVSDWNGYVAQKNDPDFGSHFEWQRDLSTGPWYVAQVAPGIHHTMGGLKINTATEVLDESGAAIPGLFACGEVTGGVHGGNRVGGNAILDCLVFGRAAGDSSAAYVKG